MNTSRRFRVYWLWNLLILSCGTDARYHNNESSLYIALSPKKLAITLEELWGPTWQGLREYHRDALMWRIHKNPSFEATRLRSRLSLAIVTLRMHTHAHTHSLSLSRTYTHIQARAHARTRARAHTHTNTHTYTHIHTHTHTRLVRVRGGNCQARQSSSGLQELANIPKQTYFSFFLTNFK